MSLFTLKAPITTATDDSLECVFFSERKNKIIIPCGSPARHARQMNHMKDKALFSLKEESNE